MQKKVIKAFRDKETLKHYAKGDLFISDDMERISFLLNNNFLEKKKFVIENAKPLKKEETEIEPLGGGYYKLPNGNKVRGKKKALEQLVKLESGE